MAKYFIGGLSFAVGAVGTFFLIDWLAWRGMNGKKFDIKAPDLQAPQWFAGSDDNMLRIVPNDGNYTWRSAY